MIGRGAGESGVSGSGKACAGADGDWCPSGEFVVCEGEEQADIAMAAENASEGSAMRMRGPTLFVMKEDAVDGYPP